MKNIHLSSLTCLERSHYVVESCEVFVTTEIKTKIFKYKIFEYFKILLQFKDFIQINTPKSNAKVSIIPGVHRIGNLVNKCQSGGNFSFALKDRQQPIKRSAAHMWKQSVTGSYKPPIHSEKSFFYDKKNSIADLHLVSQKLLNYTLTTLPLKRRPFRNFSGKAFSKTHMKNPVKKFQYISSHFVSLDKEVTDAWLTD